MLSRETVRDLLPPVLFLFVATVLCAVTDVDIAVERLFYHYGTHWAFGNLLPLRLLYLYGVLPAYLMAGASLLVFLGSFFACRARRFRKQALFFVLFLALGPGLLVNTVLKDHWGRPRPSHLAIFGGHEAKTYHYVWERGEAGEGKSFPSGHASMAFYLFAPYFVVRRRRRRSGYLWLAGGIAYGIVMGVARMAQGGHFPTDIIWAGGLVYLVGLLLSHLLLDREETEPAGRSCGSGIHDNLAR